MGIRMSPAERGALWFLAQHLVVGLLAAVLLGGLILLSDLGGIRTMASGDEKGWLFLLLLFFGLSETFGSVAMGVGIMSLRRDSRR